MANLAIIPARGGSQRIPRKNIKDFLGKPIIAYSIETAIKSNLFDEIMVSTDDVEIAEVAKKFGAKIPFYRSAKNSDNFATTADAINEVLDEYKKLNIEFENFCCLYSTAPFVTSQRLVDAYNLMIQKYYDSVFPVNKFGYPIQRALKIENERISMIWEENYNKRSQDLIPAYHDAGQFYWMNTNKFIEQKKVFTANSGAIILSDLEVQDIDNETDWKLAELKYRLINNNSV